MKKNVLFAVLALAVLVGLSQAQPAGPYRLAFITSTDIGVPAAWDVATSLDGADAHVQALADGAGVGVGGFITDPVTGDPIDVKWHILASTSYVDARDHTGTNPNISVGVPIYLVDQATLVATDNIDLWDGQFSGGAYSGGLQNVIGQDENGNAKTHWPLTGTYLDGTVSDPSKGPTNGKGLDDPTWIAQGNGSTIDQWCWRQWTQRPPTQELPVYAISEIIPEPATMVLMALGGLALRRRR